MNDQPSVRSSRQADNIMALCCKQTWAKTHSCWYPGPRGCLSKCLDPVRVSSCSSLTAKRKCIAAWDCWLRKANLFHRFKVHSRFNRFSFGYGSTMWCPSVSQMVKSLPLVPGTIGRQSQSFSFSDTHVGPAGISTSRLTFLYSPTLPNT